MLRPRFQTVELGNRGRFSVMAQSLKSAAVSKTDQRKFIIFQHNWLHHKFRARRFYVRLRFGGNNCRSSVDCLFRARYMNAKPGARAKRAHIRS
jgi:hypothetical protein